MFGNIGGGGKFILNVVGLADSFGILDSVLSIGV